VARFLAEMWRGLIMFVLAPAVVALLVLVIVAWFFERRDKQALRRK